MNRVDDRTTTNENLNSWPLRQEGNMRVSLRSAREKNISGNAWSDAAKQFSTTSVQKMYAGTHLAGSQQSHARVHDVDHSKTNIYQAQYKNAYNPLASALADAFGIEEAYS